MPCWCSLIALTELQLERQEAAKKKYLPKEEELNPSSRFTGNLLVQALRNCTALTDYTVEHPEADPATWRDFDIAATRILDSIIKSKLYAEYMDSPAGDFATDAAFWREVLRSISAAVRRFRRTDGDKERVLERRPGHNEHFRPKDNPPELRCAEGRG